MKIVNSDIDKTQVVKTCNCHDCIQFGLTSHPTPSGDDQERTALTVKSYGALPLKPKYSSYLVYKQSLELKPSA